MFLILNDLEIKADFDAQETLILGVAAGEITRQELVEWLKNHIVGINR
jgi:death-on-curing protein